MNDDNEENPPDIFHAAQYDDPVELALAIQMGQSLDDFDAETGFTPMHLACINKSERFLALAIDLDFDPWIQDINCRFISHHAWANGLKDIHRILLRKMDESDGPSRGTTPFPSGD